jgi:hypothetical protein
MLLKQAMAALGFATADVQGRCEPAFTPEQLIMLNLVLHALGEHTCAATHTHTHTHTHTNT